VEKKVAAENGKAIHHEQVDRAQNFGDLEGFYANADLKRYPQNVGGQLERKKGTQPNIQFLHFSIQRMPVGTVCWECEGRVVSGKRKKRDWKGGGERGWGLPVHYMEHLHC
jgi:hypothetical protein